MTLNYEFNGSQIVSDYAHHKHQLAIHTDPTRHRVVVCGRRFGKTTFALNELCLEAWNCKDQLWLNWYIAPTYRQAKLIAWRSLFKFLPECLIGDINETDLRVTLVNGNLIELKGADHEDSLRGIPLNFAILDEYASMRSHVWEEIIQPSMVDTKGRACFIGTPKGFNHFYDLYLTGLKGSKEYNKDFKSYHFLTSDNPYIDSKELAEIRKVTDQTVYRQEYEASFEHFTGSIYSMFSREKHVVDPFEIPEDWERIVAMDYGYRNKTAILYGAVDYDGTIVIYNMIYQSELPVSSLARMMNDIEKADKITAYFVDPSARAIATEFQDHAINFQPAQFVDKSPKREVETGINRVIEYLLSGKLKIFNTCEKLIWELERYRWAEATFGADGDNKPQPLKKDDHACDALRYLVISRPDGPSVEKRKELEQKREIKKLDGRSQVFWKNFTREKENMSRGEGYTDPMGVLSDYTGGGEWQSERGPDLV